MATPYQISVSGNALDDLSQRLALATFPDELDGARWDLGAPLGDVKRLTEYWRDSFDWRKAEKALNRFLHFMTSIQVDGFDPLNIHFIHEKSRVPNAIPLLYVHGWPGSFYEGTKIIEELAGRAGVQPAFDVVAISLPNFGFSEGPKKRGFAIAQYAECCHKLMLQLGYPEYVTQGGDWGFYITRAMALLYPEHLKATHINMPLATQPTFTKHPLLALQHAITPYNNWEKEGHKRTKWFTEEGSGYRQQQATKPQTLGYGLADSPVALLAWIYEKLHDWTDSYLWTDDEILTWVSIYWFSTAGPAANVRIYYEAVHAGEGGVTRERTSEHIPYVPVGISHNPKELRVLPKTWAKTLGHVVFEKYHQKGGHFMAFEQPENLVKDVREMFGRKGGAYGVVKGKDGYAVSAKL